MWSNQSSGAGYGHGRGRRVRGRWSYGASMPPLPPPSPGILRISATTDNDQGLNAPISYRFARAPFIVVVDIKDGKVVNVQSFQNIFAGGVGGVGVALGQWLLSSGVGLVIAPRLGPNISTILNQAGVRVETVSPGITVKVALARLGLVAY